MCCWLAVVISPRVQMRRGSSLRRGLISARVFAPRSWKWWWTHSSQTNGSKKKNLLERTCSETLASSLLSSQPLTPSLVAWKSRDDDGLLQMEVEPYFKL